MKMHLDTASTNLISDYGSDGISVNGKQYTNHLIVSQAMVVESWTAESVADLTVADFAEVLRANPEIILLGTGATHTFVHPKLQAELSAHGCGLEVMTTSAACRTYNVLVGEYRNVAAVLMQIE